MDESALSVKASLQEQAVQMGIPSRKSSCRLQYPDCGGADGLAGGRRCEVVYQAVDEAADLAVKSAVVAEEDPQDLGQGEDELPVRQPQQELLVHVLAQKQGTLLRTGGTKMEDAAAEGPKVLQSAVGALAAQARLPPWGLVHLILATPLR